MGATPVELVKERLDIVDFLRGYLVLQPAGKNFKARCPFHKERTPSFMVSQDRQSWHCFGCSLGGDVFSFLMRYENIEFGEALRVLAEKAGIELKRVNPAEYKLSGALYEANVYAKEFFRGQFETYAPAREYLHERKLAKHAVDTFELGWAPSGAEALTLHLIKKGLSPDEIIHAGLAFRTERGAIIDRFRGRIMFPIHNHFGKVAGFTGRVLPSLTVSEGQEIAKYVNTPETPIFQKSKLLYGFWTTKNAIRETKSAFVVEGQMDCLMSWQAGVSNVVASSGTAFTAEHLRTLHRLADELVFSFDNDAAGLAAGERAIDLAQSEDFHVKVVTLQGVKDPAEAAAANPLALKEAVMHARPAMLFYFEKYLGEAADFSDREGLQRLRAVLRKIVMITSPVSRDSWFRELSRRTAIEERVLREEAEKAIHAVPATASTFSEKDTTVPRVRTRLELLSERVLSYAVSRGELTFAEGLKEFLMPLYQRGLALVQEGKKQSGDPELDSVLEGIFFRAGMDEHEDPALLQQELPKEYFRRRREALTHTVRLAESCGDEVEVARALAELQKLPS